MGAYSYSGTAASNTTIDGIGSAGSDTPDNIDNLIRTLAASDANTIKDLGGANTVAGTADAITVALADVSTASYFDGMRFAFRVGTDNATTTPTLNVDSLGTKTIKRAIQGVESDLIIGDLQAGMTAEVVYRPAWASAAGAFELLNPSIASSIELGHATDTTLARSAAGVLAVEGQQVGRVYYPTVQTTTSGTEFDFNSIPSWARTIQIMFRGVSLSGADDLLVQIGDSGGVETSGYLSTSHYWTNAPAIRVIDSTAGFIMAGNSAAFVTSGIMTLTLIDSATNAWVASGTHKHDTTRVGYSAGDKALSATLDRVRITRSGANTFDAGSVNIIVMG